MSEFGYYSFESSGDSEIDAKQGIVTMEDDDAGSCIYEDLDGSESSDEYGLKGDHDEDGCGREEGEGAVFESTESNGGGGDFANEMERNRLFWEACLAS